ncbi:MAG: hypothetical protein ACREN0_08805, partial [Thermodesulfobacteriota bacterium]
IRAIWCGVAEAGGVVIRRMEVTAAGASRSYREWGMISTAAALGLVGMFLVVRRTKAVRRNR